MPTKSSLDSCEVFAKHAPAEVLTNVLHCSEVGENAIKVRFEASFDVEM